MGTESVGYEALLVTYRSITGLVNHGPFFLSPDRRPYLRSDLLIVAQTYKVRARLGSWTYKVLASLVSAAPNYYVG